MERITEAFGKTCELLSLRGFKNIGERTEPLKEKINESFSIELDSRDFTVKVFSKGFPIGMFGPTGGAMMSDGESDFIKAIDYEIQLLNGKDNYD